MGAQAQVRGGVSRAVRATLAPARAASLVREGAAINHVPVPTSISGVLLIIYAPLGAVHARTGLAPVRQITEIMPAH